VILISVWQRDKGNYHCDRLLLRVGYWPWCHCCLAGIRAPKTTPAWLQTADSQLLPFRPPASEKSDPVEELQKGGPGVFAKIVLKTDVLYFSPEDARKA
jgi:hypothetical protein